MAEVRVRSEFPRTIDRPLLFILWELDEFAVFIMPIMLTFLIRQPIIGLIAGIVLVNIYIKVKKGKPDNYFFHLFWKWGIVNIKNTPPPHIKTFIE